MKEVKPLSKEEKYDQQIQLEQDLARLQRQVKHLFILLLIIGDFNAPED